MFQELTASVRRRVGMAGSSATDATPLVRVGETPGDAVVVAQTDIGMLRGVTPSAADTAQCACPEACERDHANE
jgi:hypothetical protein